MHALAQARKLAREARRMLIGGPNLTPEQRQQARTLRRAQAKQKRRDNAVKAYSDAAFAFVRVPVGHADKRDAAEKALTKHDRRLGVLFGDEAKAMMLAISQEAVKEWQKANSEAPK